MLTNEKQKKKTWFLRFLIPVQLNSKHFVYPRGDEQKKKDHAERAHQCCICPVGGRVGMLLGQGGLRA